MKIHELIRYDLPTRLLELWRKQESETLLPLQELAVRRYDLFGEGNLLIQAPTSSGKTFIGEMAGIQAALRRKKAVYLAPLKALAEEKYLDFKRKYVPYGLRVIVSSRDHREFDGDLENGDFDVAIVVYEKLAQLLVRRPERLEQIALVIADELELLSDPERGATVELLLTRLLQSKARLIGLSAVIGHADVLAQWLKAKLVYYERRPVELRYGVLYQGLFTYRTYNDRSEDKELLVETFAESPWEILTENLIRFAEQGETCLVFVKARQESRNGAELLARRVQLPAASETIQSLRALEPTRSRDSLLETLNNGVAFHNADLSPDERRIIEQGFRNGEIRVLVSTSTLAIGMNLPARNVFLFADKWRYDNRLGMPWKTPILRSEYENMGGRAGRYGIGHAFGRSILIAATPFDYETLWRRYVEGECESIEPRLAQQPLEDHVLGLVASRFCQDEDELVQFLESTLTGQWVWRETLSRDEMAFRVRAAVNRAVDAGAAARNGQGRLEATSLGLAVAAKGITLATARELEHWIAESETRLWSDLDLLLAAVMSPDGRMVQVALTTREYDQADYVERLKQLTEREDSAAEVPLNRVRNCGLKPFFEEMRAIKTTLFLCRWIDHAAIREIEDAYHVMAGQILAAADHVSWLLDAAAALATALGAQTVFIERIQVLAERVQRGLREEALPVARQIGRGVSRNAVVGLAARGLHTPEALARTPLDVLTAWLPEEAARRLKLWATRAGQSGPGTPEPPAQNPVLVVDDRRPGEILLDGTWIRLQNKQYLLIRLLAALPGQCVPYETIYRNIWGDVIVEDNQVQFQKRELVRRIQKAVPHRAGLIETIAKNGYMLKLETGEVLLVPNPVSTAA